MHYDGAVPPILGRNGATVRVLIRILFSN